MPATGRKNLEFNLALLCQEASRFGLVPPVLESTIDITFKIVEMFQGMKYSKSERELVVEIVAATEALYKSYRNSGRPAWPPLEFQLLVDALISVLSDIETFIAEQVRKTWITRFFSGSADSTKIKAFHKRLKAIGNKFENLGHIPQYSNISLPQAMSCPSDLAPPNAERAPDGTCEEDVLPRLLSAQGLATSPSSGVTSFANSPSGAYVDGGPGNLQSLLRTLLSPSQATSPLSIQHQVPSGTIPFQPPYYQNPAPMIVIVHNHGPNLSSYMPTFQAQSPLEAERIPHFPPITINNHISNIGNSNNSTHVE